MEFHQKFKRKWKPGTETSFQALHSNLFHHALVHLVLPNVLLVLLFGRRNCHVITWHHDQRYAGTTVGSPAGAWEIAELFMPTLGTRKMDVVDAETTDIGGLLNLMEWCPFLTPPVNKTVYVQREMSVGIIGRILQSKRFKMSMCQPYFRI